jgi:soluble lytic murein transglycosylase-like protein
MWGMRKSGQASCVVFGAVVLLAGLACTPALAADCGATISDPRFSAASALCGEGIVTPEADRTERPAPAVEMPEAVTIGMASTRMEAAERAVAISPREDDALLAEIGRRYRVDPRLLAAMVHAESRGRLNAVSNKGALGVMQVMPATARSLGVADPGALLRDRELALSTGALYLKILQARLGNSVPLIVAAYNAGPGAVLKAGGRIPAFRETQGYVATVMARYAAAVAAR